MTQSWPNRALGVGAIIASALVTAGCAGLRVSTTTTVQTTSTLPFSPVITQGPVDEAAACGLYPTAARSRCRASYVACAAVAKTEVTAYYNGNAPALDVLAAGYAKSTYGPAELVWRPGYRGCLAALRAEFHHLYIH